MPRTKRSSRTRQHEAIDRSRQTYLTPQNRTTSKRHTPLSTVRKRQQTLTQINYISRVSLDAENVNLPNMHDDAPQERKRRKVTPDVPLTATVQTRSARRRGLKHEEQQGGDRCEGSLQCLAASMESVHPPVESLQIIPIQSPKTPKILRKTEIPSSQSPTDTPPSTQSRRSGRNVSRSPLKTKSGNIRRRLHTSPSAVSVARLVPKLEIEDSFDYEHRESHRFPKSQHSNFPATVVDNGPPEAFPGPRPRVRVGGKDEQTGLSPSAHNAHGKIGRKEEIQDSDNEEDEADLEDNDFGIGYAVQAAFDISNAPSSGVDNVISESLHRNDEPSDKASTLRGLHARSISSGSINVGSSGTHNKKELTTRDGIDRIPSSQGDSIDAALHHSPLKTPRNLRSESEQASAQLAADLLHLTQAPYRPVLETESQFEDAWRIFSPSRPEDETGLPQNDLVQHGSTPPRPQHRSETIPSSQATTVDVTQISPPLRRTPIHSSQIQVLQSPTKARRNRTSLPSLPLSSSPVGSRIGCGPVWDEKSLTESQLLPESLINFTIPHPPPFSLTQESLEEN